MKRQACARTRHWTFTSAAVAALVAVLTCSGLAGAQTTVVLDGPRQHVWDTMIQNGRHANANFYGSLLLTRASTDPDWERRSVMTIDTANTIPRNSTIVSATLTLTVRSGLGSAGSTRKVAAYRLTESMQVREATWNRRDAGTHWSTRGGALAERYGPVDVPVTPGAKVHFDLTELVQKAVNGQLETSWTRVALVDVDSPVSDPAAKDSYREYFSSSASDRGVRPRLTVVYGGSGSGSGGGSNTPSDAHTVVLNGPQQHVWDTMIQNGRHANTNFHGNLLLTRASTDPDWERRSVMTIDTANTIPRNSSIVSATLTLTVRSGVGSAGSTRKVAAYRLTQSMQVREATWNRRDARTHWSSPGGALAERYAPVDVPVTPGAKVNFDLTELVQKAVTGQLETSWTRIALVDVDSPVSDPGAKDSYREYFSSSASDPSVRPRLTVVYRGDPPTSSSEPSPAPPPSSPSGTSNIRFLHWNIAQGRGSEGASNIDRVVDWVIKTNPNVISFNEVMHYSSGSHLLEIVNKLQSRTGRRWYYFWMQKWGHPTGEGSAILSTFPLSSTAGHLLSFQRVVVRANITVNGRTINVFSSHLDHRDRSRRLTQIGEMTRWMRGFPEQRILGIDLNSWPGTPEHLEMKKDYLDAWEVAQSLGTAISFPGNPEGNTRNTRIDYIYVSKGASALRIRSLQVFDIRQSNGHTPSDHRPILGVIEVR